MTQDVDLCGSVRVVHDDIMAPCRRAPHLMQLPVAPPAVALQQAGLIAVRHGARGTHLQRAVCGSPAAAAEATPHSQVSTTLLRWQALCLVTQLCNRNCNYMAATLCSIRAHRRAALQHGTLQWQSIAGLACLSHPSDKAAIGDAS